MRKLRSKFGTSKTEAELSKLADAAMKEDVADKGSDEDKEFAQHSNTIKGVEIFAAGKHNGDDYSDKDLDSMVSAFQALDFRPAIKVGHTKDTPGAPAYGWVANLRREGSRLLADFTDMHDSVVDAVRKKSYDRVSSEIYFNLKRGGKTFARALKAVALLGAEVPAVAGLIPLHKMEFAAAGEFEKEFAIDVALGVSPEAIFDCLSERMAGVVQLFSEDDMKMKAQQLKELNEKLTALSAKLSGITGTDEEKGEQIKTLSAEVKAISAQIKDLSETNGDEDDDNDAAERVADKEALEQAAKDLKESNSRIEALEADGRRRNVADKVALLKVPAFRPALEAMYAYALTHNAEKVKVYSKDDKGKELSVDKTLVEIADEFVANINAQATKLFKALSATGAVVIREEGTDDDLMTDPGVELDRLAKVYMVDHPEVKDYMQAIQAAGSKNPALMKAYREQSEARQH